jgi:hypothetical protein
VYYGYILLTTYILAVAYKNPFFFFLYWAPVAGAPGSAAAMKTDCTIPGLEVPACTARSSHAYGDRPLGWKGGTLGEKYPVNFGFK